MAISLIIGKPGSGKSYYAVSKIAESMCDWARYEEQEGEHFGRKLYTNLKLDIDAISAYVTVRTGHDFEAADYIVLVGDEFFYRQEGEKRVPCEWWEQIENRALIVIDEVHQYIPVAGTGTKNYMQLWTEYIATHRHREQDIILITQHTDTIHKSVLCMAEGAYHVVNVKAKTIPFLRIPFADLDVVKEAFGCNRQLATVLYGNYLGKSFKAQSEFNIVLSPAIFALYQSHMLSGGGQDRPSLKLSKIGALFWFARRHAWHLGIKAGCVFLVLGGLYYGMAYMPVHLSKILVTSSLDSIKVAEEKDKENVKKSSVRSDYVFDKDISSFRPSEKEDEEIEREKGWYKSKDIYVYGKDYIITDVGRVEVGGEFERGGKKFKLLSVDARNKVVDVQPLLSLDWVPVYDPFAGLERTGLQDNSGGIATDEH